MDGTDEDMDDDIFGPSRSAAFEALKKLDSSDSSLDLLELASSQEIVNLVEYIGGFHDFDQLPNEIKKIILIDFTDFETRRTLRLVNRQCHQICTSNVEYFEAVIFRHYNPFNSRRFANQIGEDIWWVEAETSSRTSKSILDFRHWRREFIEKTHAVLVTNGKTWNNSLKQHLYDDEAKPRRFAFKFFLNLLKNAKINRLEVNVDAFESHELIELDEILADNPINKKTGKKLLPCESLKLGMDNYANMEWLIDRTSGLSALTIGDFVYARQASAFVDDTPKYPKSLFDKPQVLTCKQLYLHESCVIDDRQFLRLQANKMSFTNTILCERGLNAFIRRWTEDEDMNELLQVKFWRPRLAVHINRNWLIEGFRTDDFDEHCRESKWLRNFHNEFLKVHGHHGQRFLVYPKYDKRRAAVLCVGMEFVYFVVIKISGFERYILYDYQLKYRWLAMRGKKENKSPTGNVNSNRLRYD